MSKFRIFVLRIVKWRCSTSRWEIAAGHVATHWRGPAKSMQPPRGECAQCSLSSCHHHTFNIAELHRAHVFSLVWNAYRQIATDPSAAVGETR